MEVIESILQSLDAFTVKANKMVFGRHEVKSIFGVSSSGSSGTSYFALGHILYEISHWEMFE
jgi:hypothetical protein